jgi:hypothetical protein
LGGRDSVGTFEEECAQQWRHADGRWMDVVVVVGSGAEDKGGRRVVVGSWLEEEGARSVGNRCRRRGGG